MKLTTAVALLSAMFATRAQAFAPKTANKVSFLTPTTSVLLASPSSKEDEIAALRAAAAKAREEAERLSRELGKTTAAAVAPTIPKKSMEEVKQLVPQILSKQDVSKQAEAWKDLKESKSVSAFGSANLRTFPVSLKMLEQRTGLTPASLGLDDANVSLDDFKYATLWVLGGSAVGGVAALALLPPNIGATVCYFVALFPILFLGIGSSAPGLIAGAIASLRGADKSNVEAKERICRHEAAHFCCGYWCGLSVSGYSVEQGVARVEFGAASSEYSATEVAALAVTALSGLVAEALKWEKAVGAEQDLLQLEMVFRRSADFMGAVAQQDVTRWGALTAASLLRTNAEKYEKVVEAFSREAPLEECVAILESQAFNLYA